MGSLTRRRYPSSETIRTTSKGTSQSSRNSNGEEETSPLSKFEIEQSEGQVNNNADKNKSIQIREYTSSEKREIQ
jgi:hypothetical protein